MNGNKLSRLFPNASKSFIAKNCDQNSDQAQDAKPKQVVRNRLEREVQRAQESPKRVLICITSYRITLLDEDDQCEKYFVDCLRYSGLIHSDSQESASIPSPKQVKVASPEEERVEIEVSYL